MFAQSFHSDRRRFIPLFIFATLVGAFLVCAQRGGRAQTPNAPKDQPTYQERVAKNYDLRFGSNPFAPSHATSTTGTFIPGDKFLPATRCQKCHGDAHAQWRQSAHANAFREPFYQRNVKDIIGQKNIAYTRHCEACHNPAALFSGALTDKPAFKARPFDEDGVSCIACHSIQDVNRHGIGGYTMGEPALLVKEDGARLLEGVTDQMILDDVPAHRRALMRPVLKQPEFCGACHKSQVPKELNDYKFLRAFAVADELQMSSFSKESPHPFYVRDRETCNSCHMKPEAAPKFDVSAKDGVIKSHRWAAANTALPTFYNFKEQLDAVTSFLQSDVLGVDIFALRRQPAGGAGAEEFVAPLGRTAFQVAPGDTLTADVVVTNKNIGHSFPPELRDFYEAFVEFTVADDAGRVLYQSGFIKPNGHLDESAHTYKTYLVMADGSFNDKHFIWKTRTIAQNNQIASGRSDVARYRFQLPRDVGGAVRLTARLRYRRFTRVFSDYALGKSVDFPVVNVATTEFALRVGANEQQPAAKGALPDWRRWNNYGIALQDGRQFALAADAFARAAELDATYRPMALTNRALALIELDRWDEAAELLDAALAINPNLARALFQRARVERERGQLAAAETDIRRVLELFPRDRLSLQQLGELAKIKRDFQTARDAYERILAIDPEDAGAHYNLMLVYRKLGLNEQARAEARVFADLKDDPAALPVASEFLRRHPEMKGESVPFHVHDLARGRSGDAGADQ